MSFIHVFSSFETVGARRAGRLVMSGDAEVKAEAALGGLVVHQCGRQPGEYGLVSRAARQVCTGPSCGFRLEEAGITDVSRSFVCGAVPWVMRQVSPAEEGQRVQGRGELRLHPADGMGTPRPVAILSP